MSRYGKKRKPYEQASHKQAGSGRLSNQDSRDRLRESRAANKEPYHETAAERVDRRRGAERSSHAQPELRLRAPKRKREYSERIDAQHQFASDANRSRRQRTSAESNYEARSRAAERERAAGRPVRRSKSGLNSTPRIAKRSLSHKSTDPLARTGDSGRVETQRKALPNKKSGPVKKTKEQREVNRKQRARRSEQRLRILKVVGLFICAIAVLGLLSWGGFALANSGLFYPDDIQIQGARFLDTETIEDIAQIDLASSVITMDTSEVEDRLRSNPWIAQATVSTHFPSGVTIEISERTPAVKVETGEVNWVASSDGRWLGMMRQDGTSITDPTDTVDDVDASDLSIIPVTGIIEIDTGWGEQVTNESLLNVLEHLRGLDSQIVSRVLRASAPEVGRTSLFTIDEVELDVGRADNLADKSTIILGILEEHGDNVVLINVRSIDHPTWRGLSR
ncbi:MAG: FtsQ-type POTRA domain-containing protein [Coriobacteriia bacterium]|nr:FtsQ-type POTRA domain-containing protein [Coriobacteriia bacterium]MCL2745983.1 FtsQ-type POTRA domain-containing protein [Coriobacteriia bacterium]MCL2870197.1 FtsQ-type POTRA domain-containing protein [Coriobacteriia bacterium]